MNQEPPWGSSDPATVAVVSSVAEDWRRQRDADLVDSTIRRVAARDGGIVSADAVRAALPRTVDGELDVNPRVLSARYLALSRAGVLVFEDWVVSQDTHGRNAGRPARRYRYVAERAA